MRRPRHTRLAHTRARNLRNQLTISEARLWAGIKNKATRARFRRQVPIGPWIVDFACLDPKLVIEVDDEPHHWRDETNRTAYLQSRGFAILRFTNHEIATDVNMAIQAISMWIEEVRATGHAPDWW